MADTGKPIQVDGEITPVTKRPIQQIKADEWGKMTVNDLYEQRSVLQNRVYVAAQIGNSALMQQLQIGVAHLDALIEQKSQQPEK